MAASGVKTSVCTFFLEYKLEQPTYIFLAKPYSYVGILRRLLQAAILAYMFGYLFWWERNYSVIGQISSHVTIEERRGAAHVETFQVSGSGRNGVPVKHHKTIFDAYDYIIPLESNGNFFVSTKEVISAQQQGTCPEAAAVKDASCKGPTDTNTCVANKTSVNGIMTGRCVPRLLPTVDTSEYACEINGWCSGDCAEPQISGNGSYNEEQTSTVMLINNIKFTTFDIKTRNVPDNDPNACGYLKNCSYNKVTDPFCPVFELGYMVAEAGENFTEIAMTGAIMTIRIMWDCWLDDDADGCMPSYHFTRLDDKYICQKGFQMQFTQSNNGTHRTLVDATGIYFVVLVEGQGRKFDFVAVVTKTGGVLAIYSYVPIICESLVSGVKTLVLGVKKLKKWCTRKHRPAHDADDKEDNIPFTKNGTYGKI